ncbi:RNA polymerase I-specific transcription initiation factor-like protein rrn3 [Amylocarpus encephaloides]|uniref:RNA polymerase I-specific transcription initiation factor-like protein rrn3 n=1 Tax=Amylocarpus encephaloides TaxID=45428 RepID=A0A9P8C484_9HELO|nr:RNA polymerase I-specific transcription initiation factor-like protein rrn3 [Amylocarpus encephaloides]
MAPSSAMPSKSTKPLLQKATSGIIRKLSDTDFGSDLSVPVNPSKRARVTFNPNVEEKVLMEYTPQGKSLDVVRAEVRRALESHARGDNEAYYGVKAVFSNSSEDGGGVDEVADRRANIKSYVIALTSFTSSLDKSTGDMVDSMLNCEWLGRDEMFVKVYVHFLGSLVTAQGGFMPLVLENLVENFYGIRLSSGRLPGYPDVDRKQMNVRLHAALKYLLRLVPAASGILMRMINRRYPDTEDSKSDHVNYIHTLVKVMEYAPEIKSEILALITDKVVKIDVAMQVRLEDIDDDIAVAVIDAIAMNSAAAVEVNNDDSDSDVDSVTSMEDLHHDAKRVKQVQGNVEKMDAILDILFTLYTDAFSDPSSIEAASTFDMMLSHFANIILPTYRSRHTQFLLFHFAQKADYLVDQFAGTCVQLAFEPSRSAPLRQSAAAYLASFVSRGKHVEGHVVRTVFELIGNNLGHIRVENELTCHGPDLRRYGTFYAMTQALLYIFCFRWRDLLASSDVLDEDDPIAFLSQDLEWTSGIKETFRNVIYSRLNPLKVCSPPIVAEFAKIAHHLRFMYVYPLLETNKRIRLSQFSILGGNGALRNAGNSANGEGLHQLEAHFPFDPYQLPLSKRWVDDDYVQWQSIPGLEEEEEEDDDDSEDEEDEVKVADEDSSTDDYD